MQPIPEPQWWFGIEAGDWLSAILNAVSILAAILIAAYIGPRLARRSAHRDQQERLLRLLINTWQTPANPDYQSAIALVKLDFKGCKPILDARDDYLVVVNAPSPAEPAAAEEHFQLQRQKQAILISAIAHELDFDLSPESLLAGAYMSQGFVDREELVIRAMVAWQRIAAALERNNEMTAALYSGPQSDSANEGA